MVPPSSSFTLMLPDEPGVSPRSNSERPRRQISSRSLVFAALSHALAARPSRDTQRQSSPVNSGGKEFRGESPHA
jgi:hypothetical protein